LKVFSRDCSRHSLRDTIRNCLRDFVKGKKYEDIEDTLDIMIYDKENQYAEIYYYSLACCLNFNDDGLAFVSDGFDIISDSKEIFHNVSEEFIKSNI
jgi:hypothetical protein